MSDESESEYDVLHLGGNQFAVSESGGESVYRVDMTAETSNQIVTAIGQSDVDVSSNRRAGILSAVVREGPSYREGPQEQLHVTVDAPAAGNGGSSAQSGGTGGSDGATDDGDEGISSTITQEHDHDLESLKSSIEAWLESASQFKDAINPDWVSIDQAQAAIPGGYDDPDAGQTVVGFEVDTAPWFHPDWDGENNEWSNESGEEAFQDHREALTGEGGIFRNEDAVLGIQDDDGYYDNFVPADRVEDLG